jgi:hypothetical protein
VAFNNPKVPWSEVERIASGRAPVLGDGNDSPAWSRKREGYTGAPADLRDRRSRDDGGDRLRAPYAELHVHSNFSFLDGASHPETLVEEAARLELDALVLTDHDGLYGAVRFNDAARELGVRVGFGAELSLDLPAPQAGEPDPAGSHLLVLAGSRRGITGSAASSPTPRSPAGRKAARSMTSRRSSTSWPGTSSSSPAAAKARSAARSPSTVRPRRGPNWRGWSTGSGTPTSPSN